MAGRVPCLNVSVSAGVCMFEAVRQRGRNRPRGKPGGAGPPGFERL
jgi:hypothetical protein